MSVSESVLTDIGLDVVDLQSDEAFAARHLHTRDLALQMDGLSRIAQAFVQQPDTILQELVNAAITLCGAESAGVSLLRHAPAAESYYQWVATAGRYAHLLNATMPRSPSAWGICLERDRPQIFRIAPRFFEKMGMASDIITDGILLPWRAGASEGTIWIMSHQLDEAFDSGDLRIMLVLAEFAAMASLQLQLQQSLLLSAGANAAKAMANHLAHELNNPLQSVTNLVYLAAQEKDSPGAEALATALADPLHRLSRLVASLLVPPVSALPKNAPLVAPAIHHPSARVR